MGYKRGGGRKMKAKMYFDDDYRINHLMAQDWGIERSMESIRRELNKQEE